MFIISPVSPTFPFSCFYLFQFKGFYASFHLLSNHSPCSTNYFPQTSPICSPFHYFLEVTMAQYIYPYLCLGPSRYSFRSVQPSPHPHIPGTDLLLLYAWTKHIYFAQLIPIPLGTGMVQTGTIKSFPRPDKKQQQQKS